MFHETYIRRLSLMLKSTRTVGSQYVTGDCTGKTMLSIYGSAVGVTVPALSEPLMALNRPVVTAFGVEGRPAGAATSVYRLIVCAVHTFVTGSQSVHGKLPAWAA